MTTKRTKTSTGKRRVGVKKTGGVGRPAYDFDLDDVEDLASLGFTFAEMAGFFGVDVTTIEKHNAENPEFSGALKKGQSKMVKSLRRRQLERAEEGSDTMLIWLGKQVLGQRDARHLDANLNVTRPTKELSEAELEAIAASEGEG